MLRPKPVVGEAGSRPVMVPGNRRGAIVFAFGPKSDSLQRARGQNAQNAMASFSLLLV
jgi:hypothetical protein